VRVCGFPTGAAARVGGGSNCTAVGAAVAAWLRPAVVGGFAAREPAFL